MGHVRASPLRDRSTPVSSGAISKRGIEYEPTPLAFWSLSTTELLQQLQTTPEGLTGAEARQRLARYGANLLRPPKWSDVLTLLLAQFKSPIIFIILFAMGFRFFFYTILSMLLLFSPLLSKRRGFTENQALSPKCLRDYHATNTTYRATFHRIRNG